MADWDRIVDQYGRDVWTTAYRLLGNHADAADCVQETFVAAIKASRRERVISWRALLRRLATFRALDQLRRRGRSIDSTAVIRLGHVADNSNGPQQLAEARELAERLRRAIALLPPREAAVLCLRVLEDLQYDEIGQQLGLTRNAVGVLLSKARKRLRKLLNRPCTPHAASGERKR